MGKTPIKSKKKNKELEDVISYAALSIGEYQNDAVLLMSLSRSFLDIKSPDSKALLKSLLAQGIEKEPALILMAAERNLWNPKQQVTMTQVKRGTIEQDYTPIIEAYKYFQERGYSDIKSAFLASGYMGYKGPSLESFEKEFNRKEKILMKLLE